MDLHEANKKLKAGAAKAGADSSQEKKQLEEQRRQLEEQRRQTEERAKTVDQKSRTIEEKERTLQSLDQDLKKRKAKMDQLEQQLQRVNVLTSPLIFYLSKCSFYFNQIDLFKSAYSQTSIKGDHIESKFWMNLKTFDERKQISQRTLIMAINFVLYPDLFITFLR